MSFSLDSPFNNELIQYHSFKTVIARYFLLLRHQDWVSQFHDSFILRNTIKSKKWGLSVSFVTVLRHPYPKKTIHNDNIQFKTFLGQHYLISFHHHILVSAKLHSWTLLT